MQKRADFRRVELGVSQELRDLPSWQPLAARAAEAEMLLTRGQFDDSAGPGGATEFGQARAQLEAFLAAYETDDQYKARMMFEVNRVAELDLRIESLEHDVVEAATRMQTLQGLLARTESECSALATARDGLQKGLDDKEKARLSEATGRQTATEERDAARAAQAAAETEGTRLRGELAAAELVKSTLEGELAALRKEVAEGRVTAAPPAAPKGKTFINDIGQTMIAVTPGMFRMGSPATEEGRDDDEQLHTVTLTRPYRLARTEVTQKQWLDVMGGTPPWRGKSGVIEGDDVAATYISWGDAVEFCRRLTERERAAGRLPAGMEYRLPTEAEWEFATRAGTSTRFSFGEDDARLGQFAVFDGAREGQHANRVATRLANPWGFHDLHGNVWEWCQDAAGWNHGVVSDAYREAVTDPVGGSGPQRVIRGGSWYFSTARCRSADRGADGPGFQSSSLGFQPVLAARSDVQ